MADVVQNPAFRPEDVERVRVSSSRRSNRRRRTPERWQRIRRPESSTARSIPGGNRRRDAEIDRVDHARGPRGLPRPVLGAE